MLINLEFMYELFSTKNILMFHKQAATEVFLYFTNTEAFESISKSKFSEKNLKNNLN